MSASPTSPKSLTDSLAARLRPRFGLIAVSGGALLWGTTGIGVRIISDRTGLTAVPIGCYRLIISAVVLALLFRGSGWHRIAAAWRRHRWALVGAGVGLGGYQALYFLGVQYVGVSVSTLVSLAVAPVALTIGGALTRRELPSAAASATVACAVGGLALISLASGAGAAAAPHPLAGVLASLGSGLGYAATTVVNRRLAVDSDPLLLTGATSGIGALALLPIAVPLGMGLPHDGIALGWLAYIGIACTAVAYGLFYLGLRSTPPEVAGVLTLLEPLTATVLAAVVLGETLSVAGWCGAAMLLIAIAALYVRRPDAEPPAL
jgi:DME family drug/metabolite transporter